jgi:hypothetical protein
VSSPRPDVTGERLVIWSNAFGVVHCGKLSWRAMVVRIAGKLTAKDEATGAVHHLTQSEWRRINEFRRAQPVRRKRIA